MTQINNTFVQNEPNIFYAFLTNICKPVIIQNQKSMLHHDFLNLYKTKS